jgi:hypothetical protein
MDHTAAHFNRREMLKLLAVAGVAVACPPRMFGQAARPAATTVQTITAFLESLR